MRVNQRFLGKFGTASLLAVALAQGVPVAQAAGGVQVIANLKENSAKQSQYDLTFKNTGTTAVTGLSARVYIDISELTAQGYTGADVKCAERYDTLNATCTIAQHSGKIYYANIDFSGVSIPAGATSSAYKMTLSLSNYVQVWNGANDPSTAGLTVGSAVVTSNIAVFKGTTLISGNVPGGASSSSSSVASSSSSSSVASSSSSSRSSVSSSSSSSSASVPSGTTAGVVTSGGSPIVNALVYVASNPSISTRTDSSGAFSLRAGVGATVKVAAQGYASKNYTFTAGQQAISLSKQTLPAGVIYYNDYDNLTPGLYTDKRVFSRDMGTNSANGFIKAGDDEQTTNRITADVTDKLGNAGGSVKIWYPAGANDSKPSGAQWINRFPDNKAYNELYVSYWVKPSSNHDFTLGGKLPGMGGDLLPGSAESDWSGKLMWREQGALQFYMHVTASNLKQYDWNYTGTVPKLQRGVWQHIELHYRLNTGSNYDGLLEAWLNGRLVGRETNFKFANAGDGLAGIQYFFFSTFYGGDITYAPKTDQYMWFDEVTVSTSRIGYDSTLAN